MSTSAVVAILDYQGEEIALLEKHWDGYPHGVGKKLLDWGKGRSIVGGIGADTLKGSRHDFVGPWGMAASCVAALKEGIGDVYLWPPGTNLDYNWRYTLSPTKVLFRPAEVRLTVQGHGGIVYFDSLLGEFNPLRFEGGGFEAQRDKPQ